MKYLILCILFISCTNVEEFKYVPKEVITNDTLSKLVNNARLARNLTELKSENLLIELSKTKAIQMENDKEVNHNGFTSLPIQTETYGQIVGYGYENENDLFLNYMKSFEHKDKILGNYTHIGSYTYKTYNCVLFAKY